VKDNPISHVSYSYGAQVIVLNDEGKITKAVSAFDVGTPVNIQSVEGQIEGGMLMGIGYGVTEKIDIEDGVFKSRFGTIGFMRADAAPELEVILCRPAEGDELPYSLGAKGCGELCMIPTAPACAHAYYRYDGKFRQSLPLEDTPYRKKK
jgi:CO/xanthine dehydrogenase Mo-binding subunit